MLADRPKPAKMYDIILYSKGGSDMNLKTIKPNPSAKKFAMKVKVFLRLFSRS